MPKGSTEFWQITVISKLPEGTVTAAQQHSQWWTAMEASQGEDLSVLMKLHME